MNVTELRIGNYIFDREKPVDLRGSQLVNIITGKYMNEYKYIPLTEKWLLDFGFEKDNKGSVSVQFNYGENPLTHDHMIQLIWLKKLPNYELEEYPFYRNGHFAVKYVHQLQNLYFALTNNELKRVDGF